MLPDRLALEPLAEGAFPLTHRCLRDGLAEGVAPGFVAGIWRASEPALARVVAMGSRRATPSVQPMETGTIFDLASVSKVFATATLAATLLERGWIGARTPLAELVPECRWEGIELRHLLAHTAGFPAWQPLWERLREQFGPGPIHAASVRERQRAMRELVTAVAPEAAPGARALYSDISFLLLGFALEEATSLPLDRAVERHVWAWMGVEGAHYRRVTRAPGDDVREAAAATEDSSWRGGVLQGQVHDDNTWAMGGYAGHAGAFGTAHDVLTFGARWLSGFFSRATTEWAWTRVSPPAGPSGCERTPGWDTPSGPEPALGRGFSPRSVGHLGFTGTSLWLDPEAGIAVTLLSNRVHPTRENARIKPFRPRFHDALAADLRARHG
jgi:CubicO group peptidase (beta-lactamase class C family)